MTHPPEAPRRFRLERGAVSLSGLDFGGTGAPVLLLHGLAGHAGEWRQTAGWLTHEHRVLALDERGHGHSTTRPGDVSPEARVADVALAIEQLAAGPVVLAGQSLGAHLAFLVAAGRPDLVRALIVAEAHPGADPDGAGASSIDRWLASWPLPFATREAAVSFFGGPGLRGEAWADGLVAGEGGVGPRFDREVMVQMLREATREDHWTDWEAVVCPALVVRAGEGYFPASELKGMAARAVDGRYAEIAGAGHDLHLEAPDAWRRVVGAFLLTAIQGKAEPMNETMTEHTIVIEREFDAPRELVWRVWTDPDEVAKWWGPQHFRAPREKIEFDLRPEGVCRLRMVGPDGEEYPSDGHFRIVEPPARLSFGEEITDHPMIESSETTIEFVALGDDRTRVRVTSQMVCAEAMTEMARAGWSSQLDKLAALLAR